jgi:hypothetical protein
MRRKNEKRMITEPSYPPPPPPPPAKSSRNMLVIAVVIVIIIAAVAGGAYYFATTSSSSTNPTPTPSATPTATPTSSPTGTPTPTPSSTPSGNNPIANFRAGTWANYIIKTYGTAGEVTSENTMKYSIDEGTYSGVACWLLKVEMQMNEDSGTIKTVMTYWMNKNTLEGIHVKTQMYTNDELTYEHEEDISPSEAGDMPKPIDISTVTGHETITVPAGTFDCIKVTVTSTAAGTTTTTSQWVNSNIPVIGLVKIETTSGGVLQSTTELTAYGG